jgi:hypothetical protein
MALDDGQAITDIFETVYDGQRCFHLEQLSFGPFLQAAIKRATRDKVQYSDKACKSSYGPQNPEIIACSLALMFGEYAGRLLSDKADDGHGGDGKPSPMHMKMVEEFRARLEDLVNQIKAREAKWRSTSVQP